MHAYALGNEEIGQSLIDSTENKAKICVCRQINQKPANWKDLHRKIKEADSSLYLDFILKFETSCVETRPQCVPMNACLTK